jgi:hypothetical protein
MSDPRPASPVVPPSDRGVVRTLADAEDHLRLMFQKWANNHAVWRECQEAIDAFAAAARADALLAASQPRQEQLSKTEASALLEGLDDITAMRYRSLDAIDQQPLPPVGVEGLAMGPAIIQCNICSSGYHCGSGRCHCCKPPVEGRSSVEELRQQYTEALDTIQRLIAELADMIRQRDQAFDRGVLQAQSASPVPHQETWQPIETCPKDGRWLLGWHEDFDYFVFRDGPGLITGEDPMPTHWMPLPAPPETP